jgi:hypothetical protein
MGQVYLIAGRLAVAGGAVAQPVNEESAAPSKRHIIIQFILFIVISFFFFVSRPA